MTTHDRSSRRAPPRRVFLTSKKAHKEMMSKLEHMHQHQLDILTKLEKIMSDQEDLVAAVARVQGIAASVRTALTELSKKVAALQNNTQAKELAASINASVDDIAAAVEENPDPDPAD